LLDSGVEGVAVALDHSLEAVSRKLVCQGLDICYPLRQSTIVSNSAGRFRERYGSN